MPFWFYIRLMTTQAQILIISRRGYHTPQRRAGTENSPPPKYVLGIELRLIRFYCRARNRRLVRAFHILSLAWAGIQHHHAFSMANTGICCLILYVIAMIDMATRRFEAWPLPARRVYLPAALMHMDIESRATAHWCTYRRISPASKILPFSRYRQMEKVILRRYPYRSWRN